MLVMKTQITTEGFTGKEITDFLLNCEDEAYRAWWTGTHLELHTIKRYPDNIGNLVYMDEFIGKHRVKMKGIVVSAVPGREIVWQLKKIAKLPVRLYLELEDNEQGVRITHTIEAGFKGFGSFLDPILRMYFSEDFEQAMDEHVRIEFPKLRDMLHSG